MMNLIKTVLPCIALTLIVGACGVRQQRLTITNDLDTAREGEIVEVDLKAVTIDGPLIVTDTEGNEIVSQITADSMLIFPATVGAGSSADYYIRQGVSQKNDTTVSGALYPWRKDDMTWENEHSAYRAYGPELQRSGERGFGYDIWTKSVDTPVVAQRYRDHAKGISFHEDHGKGMDVYAVGPTLGGGTAALIESAGEIVYPWAFSEWEIIDNGPLRFKCRLTYLPTAVDGDSSVVETRVISLDSGSWLNKTIVSYDGLTNLSTIAPGIVVHTQNSDGFELISPQIMAYADSTQNASAGNGVIYVGIVAPDAKETVYRPFDKPQGDAVGHILATSSYRPGTQYVYFWGSGWSKGGVDDMESWQEILNDSYRRMQNPLKVTINP